MLAALSLLISLASLLLGDSNEIDITFVGDAMQHQMQLDAAQNAGGGIYYDYSECFDAIEPIIKAADYAVVNLECPLGGKNYSGYPAFCAPDSYAEQLHKVGFDLALTANNHILDRGDLGLARTLSVLDSIGFAHVGTYSDPQKRDSLASTLIDIKGFKVAFLNYTYSTNGIQCPKTVTVDYLDLKKIKRDISSAREKGAEIVIVCPHWGEEYHLSPSKTQIAMADSILTYGADIIMGSHPHVVQPMELTGDSLSKKLVVYSLGNFISNMRTSDTCGGALCTVKIRRDNHGKPYVADATYRLLITLLPESATKGNFKVVPVENLIYDSRNQSRRDSFVKNAEDVFRRHNKNVSSDNFPLSDYNKKALTKRIPTLINRIDD